MPKIAFPRKRQLTQWEKTALIVGPPVLIVAIVVGIIVENTGTEPSTSSTAAATPADSPGRFAAASPTAASVEQQIPGDGSEDEPLRFGSTAHFTSTAGSDNISLEFTVSAPTGFTPSKDAVLFDATDYAGAQPGSMQKTNVFFTVTIENTSTTQAFDPDFVFSHVHRTGDDDQISDVHDGDIDGFFSLTGRKIKPGQKVIIKDGYSVHRAETILYEPDVDGLAGRSFYFSR
jgi:hypothetical protein